MDFTLNLWNNETMSTSVNTTQEMWPYKDRTEVADLLNVHRLTVWRWTKAGMPHERKYGRLLYQIKEVIAWRNRKKPRERGH